MGAQVSLMSFKTDQGVIKETILYQLQIALITFSPEYSQAEYGDGCTSQPYSIVIDISVIKD